MDSAISIPPRLVDAHCLADLVVCIAVVHALHVISRHIHAVIKLFHWVLVLLVVRPLVLWAVGV